MVEVGEVAELGRDWAGEIVWTPARSVVRLARLPSNGRIAPGEIVGRERQRRQVDEVAQFGRNRAGEIIGRQRNARHPILAINAYSVPLVESGFGKPVFVVGPRRPTGRAVQQFKGLAVR